VNGQGTEFDTEM